MSLTIDQLRSGISYWRLEKFPPDFHNTYYERVLVAVRANGVFNQAWWDRFFPVLKSWKATRGTADSVLTVQAQARFEALSKTWAAFAQRSKALLTSMFFSPHAPKHSMNS